MAKRRIELKGPEEIEQMREAGRVVARVLRELERAAEPGVSTLALDRLAEELTLAQKARPAFKGYHGFPGCLCASLNEEVVHGIPRAERRLAEGDLLKLDFGVVLGGWYGDAAVTVPVGKVSARARRLLEVTRESLEKAIARMVPGNRVSDLAAAVQDHAEVHGFSVVREFVGHGIGRALHEAPQVPNFRGFDGQDARLQAGMVLAVEPMVNAGVWRTEVLADRWTAVTADRQLSAHFEHTVAIVEGGPVVLSEA